MKNRFLFFICATLTLSRPFAGWAFVAPAQDHLPNYDVRDQAIATVARAQSPVRLNAESLLRARIPTLQLHTDSLLGTPRLLSAQKGFLTGPGGVGNGLSADALASIPQADPNRTLKAFLNEHAAVFGHDSSVLDSAKINRDYVTAHNGLRTVVFQQTHNDIPIYESLLVSHITRNGELVSISDRFVPDVAAAAASGTPDYAAAIAAPPISAYRAISVAAANLDLQIDEAALSQDQAPQGVLQKQTVRHELLFGPAHAEMTWLPLSSGSIRLCWQVVLAASAYPEQYLILIDAGTGEILVRRNLTAYAREQNYNVYNSDSPSPFSPGWQVPDARQPAVSNRTVVKIIGALSTNASPADWIFSTGPNNNTTIGNNVQAFLDRNFDQQPDGPTPIGTGTNLTFNFPLDLTRDPLSYSDASVVQAFYRVNWYHDTMYGYGFTEAAGNFQKTNFNRGGFGQDEVMMLVQAGADAGQSDNAFFSSPPDGINGTCAMFIWSFPRPNRDGSLDSEIVLHELTHGLSNRLLGGGPGITQLQTRGMGEGWSDFVALSLLSEANDDPHLAYANGGYVTYQLDGLQENYYYGVRRYPYCTDMSKNPLTLKDIDPTQASAHAGVPINPVFGGGPAAEVHNQGEVWCALLWEVRANIIDELGGDAGNKLMLQLVTDGLKLAPPNATYTEARDGILLADQIDTGGSFYESIWTGFAKRGLGFGARVPVASSTTGVVESYTLPPDIIITPPDGILEVKITPASGAVLFLSDTNSIFVRVKDTIPVTNATVTVTVGANNIVLKNDGKAPDFSSKDSTYSGTFLTPATGTSITLPILVTAPGKTNSTNSVTYALVPTPPNDMFTNSLKVAFGGDSVFTSNKRATIEADEPVHGGDASVAASLWYTYVPPTTGDVLVDTTGSDFTSVVAVYTNNSLTNLVAVASAVGNPAKNKGAFVNFRGTAGIVYHIAVSGATPIDTGGLRLRIGQGLTPDTNPPFASIVSPKDGLTVSSSSLVMLGTAVDPEPQPSGIRQIKISISSGAGQSETVIYPAESFDGPPSTNWSATVFLSPGVNNIFVTAIDFAGNQSTPATVQVTYRAIDPANDFFVLPQPITNNSGVFSINTLNATKEGGEPNHAGVVGGKSAWWIFTPDQDGVLNLSTTNSTFDTVLAVYTGSTLSTLVPVGSNDDAYLYSQNGFSQLAQPVKAGVTYHIAVDGFIGTGGALFLSYSFTPGQLNHITLSSNGGGVATTPILDVQSNATVVVTATPADGYVFSVWNGDVVSVANPLTVTVRSNMTLTAEFLPLAKITDDFETGDLSLVPWVTSGDAPWTVQSAYAASGQYAARSGSIQGNQSSSLQLTGSFRVADGSFDVKVSSEPVWDRLSFYIDGLLQQQWSGEVPWTTFAFSMPAGNHTVQWVYSKDSTSDAGLDAAFIDNINLPTQVPINAETPAQLSLLKQSDGNYYIQLLGQTNQIYTLQASTNLVSWSDLTTDTANAGVIRYFDPASVGTKGARYYRAVAH
jgi:hypothetical protein